MTKLVILQLPCMKDCQVRGTSMEYLKHYLGQGCPSAESSPATCMVDTGNIERLSSGFDLILQILQMHSSSLIAYTDLRSYKPLSHRDKVITELPKNENVSEKSIANRPKSISYIHSPNSVPISISASTSASHLIPNPPLKSSELQL